MAVMPAHSIDDISSVAALDDPVRQALYRHIATRPEGVNRDEAARAVKISRTLAAYHLDRLAEIGLLDVEYRRPPGRSGPGAGRPAKIYRRSTRPVQVSLPPRNFELAATLLVKAVDPSGMSSPSGAVTKVARDFGTRLGVDARARSGRRPSKRRLLQALDVELEANGFEPEHEGNTIMLRNCPFDALAQTHRNFVCGMNLALMEGVVDSLGVDSLTATLDPKPGRCCVVLRADRT